MKQKDEKARDIRAKTTHIKQERFKSNDEKWITKPFEADQEQEKQEQNNSNRIY